MGGLDLKLRYLSGASTNLCLPCRRASGIGWLAAALLTAVNVPALALDLTWTEGSYSANGFPTVLGSFGGTYLDLTGPENKPLDRSIENGGEINLRGGTLEILEGKVLTNNRTLNVFPTGAISTASAGTISNSGTINWATTRGPLDLGHVDYWKLSGVSLINSGALVTDGIVEYTGGGSLTFNDRTSFQTYFTSFTQRPGVHKINKSGIVTFNLPYTSNFDTTVVELANGTFVAAHEDGFRPSQNFVWSGGQLSGKWTNVREFKANSQGEKILAEGASFLNQAQFELAGGTLTLKSGADFHTEYQGQTTPQFLIHGGTTIRVEAGVFLTTSRGDFRKVSGEDDATILVEGSANFGGEFGRIDGEREFRVDAGRVNIEGNGMLVLNPLHIVGPGRVRMATTGDVWLNASISTDEGRRNTGIRVSGAGLEIGGGYWRPSLGSSLENPMAIQGDVHWTGGTLEGHWSIPEGSTWTVSGDGERKLTDVLENHGTIKAVGPVLLVTNTLRSERIVNAGVMRFESDYVFPFGGMGVRTENRPGATIEIASGPVFLALYGPRKVEGSSFVFEFPENRGKIVVSGGSELLVNPQTYWDNFGEIVLEKGGKIYLDNVKNYGRMSIDGRFFGLIKNEGELSLGPEADDDPFPGSVALGSAGTLVLKIESSDSFDSLRLSSLNSGEAPELRGRIVIKSAGYRPAVGESISVLSGTIHGQFSDVSFEGFDPALRLGLRYGAHGVTVEVAAVPEPATWCMFGVGGALVAGAELRRRRRLLVQ